MCEFRRNVTQIQWHTAIRACILPMHETTFHMFDVHTLSAFSKLFTLQITFTIPTVVAAFCIAMNKTEKKEDTKKTCDGLHARISTNFRVPIATKLVITNERIISAHVLHVHTFDSRESRYCYLFSFYLTSI